MQMTAAGECIIRRATPADLDGVQALEQACFGVGGDSDAQSRRSLAYLIVRARSDFLVALEADRILADVIVLYRRNSAIARLYSIAVADVARGRGLASGLLSEAEVEALGRGCQALRAEARISNRASRLLFARAGYHERERLPDYYPSRYGAREDGVRLEKNFFQTE